MNILRAPTELGPTMHVRWVTLEGIRHIGTPLTMKTACDVSFEIGQVDPVSIGQRKTPLAEICPKCLAWMETDAKKQGGSAADVLTCGHHTGFKDGQCEELATWIRFTQFSGNHLFCTKHAEQEEGFGEEDPSYFFWKALSVPGGTAEERKSVEWP